MTMQQRLNWFGQLKKSQSRGVTNAFDLLVELDLGKSNHGKIKGATSRYLHACLGKPAGIQSDGELMALVETKVDELANRTPNGVLMPKREFEDEFNDLHRVVSSYVRSLAIDGLIYSVQCPIIVRMAKGADDSSDARPYASSKIHLDLWSGDPWDEVIVSIPMLGDIGRTTVEYFHPLAEVEVGLLRAVTSYDEALQRMGEFEPCPLEQRPGYAYFADALVPHRTVKRGGGIRVTVEFRLRRLTTQQERDAAEAACDSDRLNAFLSYPVWHHLGTSKRMQFSDTYADAKRGIFVERPYNEQIYTLVDV